MSDQLFPRSSTKALHEQQNGRVCANAALTAGKNLETRENTYRPHAETWQTNARIYQMLSC